MFSSLEGARIRRIQRDEEFSIRIKSLDLLVQPLNLKITGFYCSKKKVK